jgi:hypothetical protein
MRLLPSDAGPARVRLVMAAGKSRRPGQGGSSQTCLNRQDERLVAEHEGGLEGHVTGLRWTAADRSF